MASDWASENLKVIRTLMERSSIYRRALAPTMLAAGAVGLIASMIPCFVQIESGSAFAAYWMVVGALGFALSVFLVRRQAVRDGEVFWSPPTRRVAQALSPAFTAGLVAGLCYLGCPWLGEQSTWLLPALWMILYGCALHAAGFFMPRGIRLFGWAFLIFGALALMILGATPRAQTPEAGHYLMGMFFGVAQLAYGGYLLFTEKRKNGQ